MLASLVSSPVGLWLLKYFAVAVIAILAVIGGISLVVFYQFLAFNKFIGHPANTAFAPADLSIQKGDKFIC